MSLSIATWNINSVRLRIGLVGSFLDAHAPDILCLQEIKCPEAAFPYEPFRRRGYDHILVNGQKGYHGVAIVSKLPFVASGARGFCGKDDARHAAVAIADGGEDIVLHNFYVPAGGDEPDPAINEKFAHKLAFLDEMKAWLTGNETDRKAILVGDLNIAPLRERRLVAQAAPEGRQPHAGRDRGARVPPPGRRLGRRGPPFRADRREALHLVELSRRRLGGLRPRPPARPHLGDAAPRAAP